MTVNATLRDVTAAVEVEIDIIVEAGPWPPERDLRNLAARAIAAVLAELDMPGPGSSELSLVFTDDAAVRSLNARWRGKDAPTNVLSFPAHSEKIGEDLPPMLGDIVLAAETVAREAALEDKPLDDHITHLIVHGFLHLVGLDHETDVEAEAMEALERRTLARLAIRDPYA